MWSQGSYHVENLSMGVNIHDIHGCKYHDVIAAAAATATSAAAAAAVMK